MCKRLRLLSIFQTQQAPPERSPVSKNCPGHLEVVRAISSAENLNIMNGTCDY